MAPEPLAALEGSCRALLERIDAAGDGDAGALAAGLEARLVEVGERVRVRPRSRTSALRRRR